jgi:type IX secretion system PorP/SprF family membrane protein
MKKQMVIYMVLMCIISDNCFAQDPHFSQFFVSPLSLNPALTGHFDGTLRAAGNYRNQWANINKAFVTSTASVDAAMLKEKLPEGDAWGIGFLGMNDISGGGVLKRNIFSLSTAYHKSLDDNGYHSIGLGFQASYSQMRVDLSKALFSDMLTANGFTNASIDPVTNNFVPSVNYLDVGAGALYQGTTNGNNSFYVGASLYHFNQPKESFLDQTYKLNRRLSVHGSGFFPLSDQLAIHANTLYQLQGASKELVAGAALGYTLYNTGSKYTAVYAGLWSRFANVVSDAVVPYLGLEYNSFRLGISYDVNISSLKTVSYGQGAMEFSLIYVKNNKGSGKSPRFMHCPKF